MARGNFKACLGVTLPHEGGWSDHPADPGGATMKGITIGRFREFKPGATKADLRAISDLDVETIYREGYWNQVRGEELPHGVDLAVFDFGVNSGPARAARHLQAVAGVKQDGKVGLQTLAATGKLRGDDVVKRLCGRRLSFVQGLKTFKVFGKGWSRRIADVEARGVAMWLKASGTAKGAAMALEDEAAKAKVSADRQKTGATASAGGGVGGGGIDIAAQGGLDWITVAVIVVGVTAAVLFALKSRQNRDRAEAYARVASEVGL